MSQSLQRRRRHTDIYYLLCCPSSCLDDYNENVLEGHDKRLSTRASAKTIFLRLVQPFSYVQQEEAHLPMYSWKICAFTILCSLWKETAISLKMWVENPTFLKRKVNPKECVLLMKFFEALHVCCSSRHFLYLGEKVSLLYSVSFRTLFFELKSVLRGNGNHCDNYILLIILGLGIHTPWDTLL